MAELGAGDSFAGYTIEGVAGRGGMGVVYRATQARPRRTVALKVIAENLAADSAFRKRFERESDIAASIEHANVLPVYEAGEVDGRVFIAMRFVEGTDLRAAILAAGRLELPRATRILAQLAGALDAAHARGLVHRDVKPANVLLTGSGDDEHAYLTDFGVSKSAESKTGITQKGEFVGTVDYIAPEQVETGRADARSDVYSLGCMLYETLTGQVPFPREVHAAKLYAHMQDPPPHASEVVPRLPAELDAVIERAMAKDPDQRYQSAGDFSRAASAAIRREPTQAGTPTRAASATAAPRRRPVWPIAAVALVALAALAGFLLAGGSDDDADDPPSEAQTRSLLESYSARYTSDDISSLASLLAPDLERYVAGNPPQNRDEAIANFQTQLDQVEEPRYTFDAPIRIETDGEHAVATTRYRIVDRQSRRAVSGVVATGAISYRVRDDDGTLLIDEIRIAPDILLRYIVPRGGAPTDVKATATVAGSAITRPASTAPAQADSQRTTIAERTFALARAGENLLELPLNDAGRRGLRWGTELRVEYRENGRLTDVATAEFTERGYIFREP